MDSILDSIKKLLGLDPAYDHFDTDLVIHINSVLVVLHQLGVGEKVFTITGSNETWKDFLGDKVDELSMVQTYIGQKVRLMFDPPTGSTQTAVENVCKELEARISYIVDGGTKC